MTNAIQLLKENDILKMDIKSFLESNKDYQNLIKGINKALEESAAIVVVTYTDVAAAANYVANFKRITKTIESLRREIVQPLIDKKTEIDGFFKRIPSLYESEQKRLEEEILQFKRKEEEEARRKAEEERKRLEEEALEKAIAEGRDEPAIIPEVIPQIKKISELNESRITTRRTKTFKIIDETKIPREYLMIDEKKIRAERMKYDYEAKSTIPGVEFTFEETVV